MNTFNSKMAERFQSSDFVPASGIWSLQYQKNIYFLLLLFAKIRYTRKYKILLRLLIDMHTNCLLHLASKYMIDKVFLYFVKGFLDRVD